MFTEQASASAQPASGAGGILPRAEKQCCLQGWKLSHEDLCLLVPDPRTPSAQLFSFQVLLVYPTPELQGRAAHFIWKHLLAMHIWIQAIPKRASLKPLVVMFKLPQLGFPVRVSSLNVLSRVVHPCRNPPGTGASGWGSTAPSACSRVLNSPAGQGTAKVLREQCIVSFFRAC